MREQAKERIGHQYPDATIVDNRRQSVDCTTIAWIWARTVACPNPACGIEMPLVRSWWLGKKKGKEAYVVPSVVADATAPSGRRVDFAIGHDRAKAPPATMTMELSPGKARICISLPSRSAVKLTVRASRSQSRSNRFPSIGGCC